jgi:D-arabinitol dehydrogenase (NADP+)
MHSTKCAIAREWDMRAVVFSGPGELSVTDVPEPVPGTGEVVLRPIVTGVCGTDLHLLAGGFLARYPLIPGHEIVAEVVAAGPGVTTPSVGTVVAADNTELCGYCPYCRAGKPLFCSNFRSLGVNAPGGFAEFVRVKAEKCFGIDGLDPMVAVMTEPLACAVHGADTLALEPGSDVLIFGAGPTGLLLAQLLVHGNAARVTVAAPSLAKLQLAERLGVDRTVVVDRADPAAATPELLDQAPLGYDAVVEATGVSGVLAGCLPLTRTGGTVLVYGVASEDDRWEVSPYEVFARELTIKGSFAQTHCFDRALRALTTGRVRTDGIVTDVVPLSRFDRALAAVRSSESIKAVVVPG